jgi:glycosyltransferase involved in cell wall biosynthesis
MPSLVSLVMTVYNREAYLRQALDSILSQTYPHWHLILWDDGSTDRSPNIAQTYAQRDSRILFIPAPHSGRQKALDAAIKTIEQPAIVGDQNQQASRYLAFVDSDDLLAPETLTATTQILDNYPQIGMVYTDHWIIDESFDFATGSQIKGLGARCQIPYSKDRLLIDFMTFHFRLLRKEIYDAVGGIDLEYPRAEDYDLCLKVSEITGIYHLRQPLYYYRVHPATLSQGQRQHQVECSATRVRNALVRRGLSNQYRLEIIDGDRFTIVRQ